MVQGKKTPPFCNGGDSLLGILANHILRGDTRATIKGLIQYREQPFAIRYCVDIGWVFQHSHDPNSIYSCSRFIFRSANHPQFALQLVDIVRFHIFHRVSIIVRLKSDKGFCFVDIVNVFVHQIPVSSSVALGRSATELQRLILLYGRIPQKHYPICIG